MVCAFHISCRILILHFFSLSSIYGVKNVNWKQNSFWISNNVTIFNVNLIILWVIKNYTATSSFNEQVWETQDNLKVMHTWMKVVNSYEG